MRSIGIIKELNIDAISSYLVKVAEKNLPYDHPYVSSIKKATEKATEDGCYIPKDKYEKIEDLRCKDYYNWRKCLCDCSKYCVERKIEELKRQYDYSLEFGQPIEYCYADENIVLFELNRERYAIENKAEYLILSPYKDYSNTPVPLIGANDGLSAVLPVINDMATETSLKGDLANQKDLIEQSKKDIEAQEQAIKDEIEEAKRAIEAKYASMLAELREKTKELELKKTQLENEIFVLDTQIYGIRCFFGETVKFTQLTKGAKAGTEEPVVLHQKIRFLDEELAKYVSLYNVDGDDTGLFEQLIQAREDLRDLFFPGEKSISLIRISRDGVHFSSTQAFTTNGCRGNVFTHNILKEYEVYHGKKIGILVRNGENCYIGWTDEDRIDIADGNAFLTPHEAQVTEAEEKKDSWGRKTDEFEEKRTNKHTVASRYFLFSIMQGLVLNSKLINLPDGIDIVHGGQPYVIYSMADAWITDNRFGSFEDILEKYHMPLRKGDDILCLRNLRAEGNMYARYSNDRGVGYRNRTHDVKAENNTVYPVNLVEPNGERRFNYVNKEGKNTYAYCKCDSVEEFLKRRSDILRDVEMTDVIDTDVYISLEKDENWIRTYNMGYDDGKRARANFMLYSDEWINLTFLNTILIQSVIINRSIGNERSTFRGVNFSTLLPYLNNIMAYLKEREKEEAALIEKYIVLPHEWQLLLSEWKLEHDVHKMTDYQAKRFAKWFMQN